VANLLTQRTHPVASCSAEDDVAPQCSEERAELARQQRVRATNAFGAPRSHGRGLAQEHAATRACASEGSYDGRAAHARGASRRTLDIGPTAWGAHRNTIRAGQPAIAADKMARSARGGAARLPRHFAAEQHVRLIKEDG
jgi:hypothetical protein